RHVSVDVGIVVFDHLQSPHVLLSVLFAPFVLYQMFYHCQMTYHGQHVCVCSAFLLIRTVSYEHLPFTIYHHFNSFTVTICEILLSLPCKTGVASQTTESFVFFSPNV